MSSDEESEIDLELSILEKEQRSYLVREKTYSFRKMYEFKPKFENLEPIVCTDCGKNYRIVHWCELRSNLVYAEDWKTRLLTHFQTMSEVEKRIAEQKAQEKIQQEAQKINNTKPSNPKKDSGRNFCCACSVIILIFLGIFFIPRLF
jgi:hypothetical protein